MATAPFFLLINPPQPPTECLSTFNSEPRASRYKFTGYIYIYIYIYIERERERERERELVFHTCE
jgi:hypothetical protein